MLDAGIFTHYATTVLVTAVPALFAAISQARSCIAAFQAIRIQPAAEQDISGMMIIGNALIETAAIIGVVFGYVLIYSNHGETEPTYWAHMSELGILAAVGLTGAIVSYRSYIPVQAACYAIARQPFFSKKIQFFTIIMQAIMQTPIILAFIVGLLIHAQLTTVTNLDDCLRLIGAGLAIGIGSIGPTIGLSTFLEQACQSLGINKSSYSKIVSFSLVSEAMIEASVIFALIIALLILNQPHAEIDEASVGTIGNGIAHLAAGLCIGISTIGVGIGLGKIGAKACHYIGIQPELYQHLSKTSILAQALIEAQTIYAFIIAVKIITS